MFVVLELLLCHRWVAKYCNEYVRPIGWWDAGMVICLGRSANLHMAQLMPLPLTVSCFSKSRLVLPFWYWLTQSPGGRKMVVAAVVVCPPMSVRPSIHHMPNVGEDRLI